MGFFPFFTDIENKKCVVVGGGNVASGKVERLIPFNPKITVIAPEICDYVKSISDIEIIQREFCDNDIDDAFMVISATDNRELNIHISKLCRERNIPVNVVDVPELCSFYFPAIVKKENVIIGISTEGKSPVFARFLKEKIGAELDEKTLKTAESLVYTRKIIRECISTESGRKNALEEMLRMCVNDEISEDIDKVIEGLIKKYENQNRNKKK